VSRGKSNGTLVGLRGAALIAVVVGAVGTIFFMLRVGHNYSRIFLLLILFAIWDVSPFVALGLASKVSDRWPVLTRGTLYVLALIITLGSLAIYGRVALGPPRPQPAAAFLVVPLVSWLLIATVLPLAAFISRRSARATDRGVRPSSSDEN